VTKAEGCQLLVQGCYAAMSDQMKRKSLACKSDVLLPTASCRHMYTDIISSS